MFLYNYIFIAITLIVTYVTYFIISLKKNIVLLYMLLEVIILYVNILILLGSFFHNKIDGLMFSLIITSVSGIELSLCLAFIIYLFLSKTSISLEHFFNVKA